MRLTPIEATNLMDKRTANHARGQEIYFVLFLLIAAIMLFFPAAGIFFSLDDLQFLLKAAGLEHFQSGYRRAISTQYYFIVAWKLFGTRPWAYHIMSLVLHTANAWLVYRLARKLHVSRNGAYAAATLFITSYVAFLPLHWISGVQEILMTFFVLIAAYFFLGQSSLAALIALAAGCASLLCKESTILLFPSLAIVLPISKKRRWIIGSIGFAIGLIILADNGSLAHRPIGDPYETAFDTNILWNLLTYSAWMLRFWDYYPDKVAKYSIDSVGWGIILPLILLFIIWRKIEFRKSMAKSIFMFLAFLLPVLPLVRHSYFYYLYLPLIPFWIAAGAFLGKLRNRRLAVSILALFFLSSFINGIRHRKAEIADGIPENPILRYAQSAKSTINTLRQDWNNDRDTCLVIYPTAATVDLTGGLEPTPNLQRKQISFIEQALLGGRALQLFFPGLKRIVFEDPNYPASGWERMHLYLTYGLGSLKYFGRGIDGRIKLASEMMNLKEYELAKKHVQFSLHIQPNSPVFHYMLGVIASQQNDRNGLLTAIAEMERIAEKQGQSVDDKKALAILKQLTARRN